jgi:hypothetical protein
MKKIITLVLLLCFNIVAIAQKCKESVDPITNEKKIEFEFVSIAGLYFKYEITNGKAILNKEFTYTGALNVNAPAGLEVFFKLENGDVLKLKSTKESAPKMYASAYGVTTGYHFALALSKEDLNKLAASPVTLIRIPKISEEGFYDLNEKHVVVKKNKKPLQKGAACISSFM